MVTGVAISTTTSAGWEKWDDTKGQRGWSADWIPWYCHPGPSGTDNYLYGREQNKIYVCAISTVYLRIVVQIVTCLQCRCMSNASIN